MSDFEKNRAEYVTHLEAQVKNLQAQLNSIQAEARWIPQVESVLDAATQKGRVTLSFGGKNQTAAMSFDMLLSHSSGDATINVLTLGFQDMINDRLREVVEPEIARLQKGVASIAGKTQW